MDFMLYSILFIFIIPFIFGATAIFLSGRKKLLSMQQKIPALLFHSVTDKASFDLSHISTVKLESFLSYLKQKQYKTITAYKNATLSSLSEDSEGPFITLLFDDGFENFYTEVFPLFERFNMKATVFPIINYIDSFSKWDIYPSKKHLTKEQIRLISNAGYEIGSHTLTHPDLILLPEKTMIHELKESKKILEDIIQKPVKTISFPLGSWNMRVWRQAQQCGYEAAVAYRMHKISKPPVIPVIGIYAFDKLDDIIEKTERKIEFSIVYARSAVMPHFAKGTSLWNFRKDYDVLNCLRK